MAFIANPIVYFFNYLEATSGISFANFTINETPKQEFRNQPLMQQYQNINNVSSRPQMYKYLYDPNLSFDFRFHQRLASINYTDRKTPWITIMFSTSEVKPLTQAGSSTFTSQVKVNDKYFPVRTRKLLVPVKFVFISNDISFLYSRLEYMSFWLDRICNFPYKQTIQFAPGYKENYDQVGLATDIEPVDVTKLDTQRLGTLATSAYTMNIVYWAHSFVDPNTGLPMPIDPDTGLPSSEYASLHILKEIDLKVCVVSNDSLITLQHDIIK
jgi:hypothetical protein